MLTRCKKCAGILILQNNARFLCAVVFPVLRQPGGGDPGSLGSVCLPDGTCLLPTLICAQGQVCVCAPAYYNRSGHCGMMFFLFDLEVYLDIEAEDPDLAV